MTFGRFPLFSMEQSFQLPLLRDQDMRQMVRWLKQYLTDLSAVHVFRGGTDAAHVIVAIAPEHVVNDFVAFTNKLLAATELKHLFPAQVRFHALGELCRGNNKSLDWYFAATTDSHAPFADVLILPPGWRARIPEFCGPYYSSTPDYLWLLAAEQPIYSV